MQRHFVAGVDPPPQVFDRGTITAQNMVSSKLGYLTKAERFQKEQDENRMITIAAVRTENSLLCQQNTELK